MWNLARQRPGLMAAFALAMVVTLFFSVRLIRSAVYWSDPAHHNQAVEPWMTVGYVAKSWKLDARKLDALANLPEPKTKGHPQPLSEIARDRGVPVADVVAEVEKAVAILRLEVPEQ